MENQFSRTQMLLGESGMQKLQNSRVAVFGIGGVGGYAVEALVRSGVGAIDLIDHDKVSFTNLNRQIIATHSTVGMRKVDAMEARILDINPNCTVRKYPVFFTNDSKGQFDFSVYDYVVDAIDTVTGKIALVECVTAAGVPIISAMGAGNKLDATKFEVTDIYKTSVCPLARVMRRELKKHNIPSLKVVYSTAEPVSSSKPKDGAEKQVPASIAFVPSVAGLLLAGEVIKDLIK